MTQQCRMWWLVTLFSVVLGTLAAQPEPDTDAARNETDASVDVIAPGHFRYLNLAWLVTPSVLVIGLLYLIFKCCRDGLCNNQRLQARAAHELSLNQSYGHVPLIGPHPILSPHPILGPHPILFLHNETLCTSLDQRFPDCDNQPPPTYDETIRGQAGFVVCTRPPSYSTPLSPPRYSADMSDVFEDEVVTVSPQSAPSHKPALVWRRRHRSEQDGGRHNKHTRSTDRRRRPTWDLSDLILGRNSRVTCRDSLGQRCFSFNALRDVLRRSSHGECHNERLLAEADRHEACETQLLLNDIPDRTVASCIKFGVKTAFTDKKFESRGLPNGNRIYGESSNGGRRSHRGKDGHAKLKVSFDMPGSCEDMHLLDNHGESLRLRHASAPSGGNSGEFQLRCDGDSQDRLSEDQATANGL